MNTLTRLTSFLLVILLALIVSAFSPLMAIGAEETVTTVAPRPEAGAPVGITSGGPTDPEEFKAFLDPLMADFMAANHIPGGAIAVVKDGESFLAEGYGYADLESSTLATADATIFRTGSISKVFTWTAVMQLVEQGKLDLNADVNTYLTDFQIPNTFAEPITLAQLMTHTAGFEDQKTDGAMFATASSYQSLQDFLVSKMPARIFPPGQVVAYSNYGAALAGEIVAEVSGESFEQYVAKHIFEPLQMNHSTFLQPLPANMLQEAAVVYDIDETGKTHAGSFEYVQPQPAGALSATATDIAHFMIAHLQDGHFGNARILQPDSAQDMRRPYYAFTPQLPGVTRGFFEANHNGVHLVLHPGSTDLSSSLLALVPDQNVGIFMTFNSPISTPARFALMNAILDHYYPVPTPTVVSPPSDFAQRAASFTGTYLASRRAETTIEKISAPLYAQVSVVANPDNTLSINAFRDSEGVPIHWVEVSPLVFQDIRGQSLLAFSSDAQNKVTAMFHGDQPNLVFQKLAWYESPLIHVAGLGLALVVFIATLVTWPLGGLLWLVRRKPTSFTLLERSGRYLAGGVILLNLVIIGLIASVLVGDDSVMQLGYPIGFTIAGILALVSGVGVIALLVCLVGAWRQRSWGIIARLHYTLVTAAALYFVWYLLEVNVLRWPLA